VRDHMLCKALGLDTKAIYERLHLLEFSGADRALVEKMHMFVIQPNLATLVDRFYEYVLAHPQFREFASDASTIAKLTHTFHDYLDTLGKNYESIDYFNDRLRVGIAHHRIGMSLMLYECAYHKLQSLLLNEIPAELNEKLFAGLQDIIRKVVALDISLAIDSYNLESFKGFKDEIRQLFSQEEKMKHYASIDPLTGVENRSAILQRIKQIISGSSDAESYALVMIDIDNLRSINDEQGHLVGDHLIKGVVDRIRSELEKHDVLGRYGGDEFLLLLKGVGLDQAVEKMKNIYRKVCKEEFDIGQGKIKVSISQGVTLLDGSKKLIDFIKKVDKALLQAKQAEKTKIVVSK